MIAMFGSDERKSGSEFCVGQKKPIDFQIRIEIGGGSNLIMVGKVMSGIGYEP